MAWRSSGGEYYAAQSVAGTRRNSDPTWASGSGFVARDTAAVQAIANSPASAAQSSMNSAGSASFGVDPSSYSRPPNTARADRFGSRSIPEFLGDRYQSDVRLATLPLQFYGLEAETAEAHVSAVNGQTIRRIEISIADGMGEVDFRELAEHFRLGMNRFTVTAEGQSVDVLLEFEF